MITRDELKQIGFKEIPHYTVGNSLIYDLGRERHFSIICVGTPNEAVFICQADKKDYRKITDLVCVHNWDYDGFITIEKIKSLISGIVTSK